MSISKTQLFNKMLPKEVRFMRGEDPSPTKLNGAFGQLESAFFMLESFLGNGPDYTIDTNEERKMLFNISSAIGPSDKIYSPLNKVPSLERIWRKYGRATSSYDRDSKVLDVTSYQTNTTIPVEAYVGYELGIYYTGRGIIVALDGDPATEMPLPDAGTSWKWFTTTVTEDIDWFRIRKYNNSSEAFKIKSIYVAPAESAAVLNKAYSIPLTNGSYWSVKTPCKWADPDLISDLRCVNKTCSYCIGNTYNLDDTSAQYGSPLCSGAKNGLDGDINYAPANVDVRKDYFTLQAPVLTEPDSFAVRYRSYNVQGLTVDSEIPQNYALLYDTKNSASTLNYTMVLFSAGKPNILYVKDPNAIKSGIGDNKRFILLNGSYGLSNLLNEILPQIELPMPQGAIEPDIAVYED